MRRAEQSWIAPDSLENPGGAPSANALSAVLGSLVGTFSVVAFAWLAVLGFAGGTVPVLGWALPGGLAHGLAWLAVLSSAGVVLWFVPLMASMVVYAAFSRLLAPVAHRGTRPVRRPHPAKSGVALPFWRRNPVL